MSSLIECYKNVSEDIWYRIDFTNKLKFKFGEVAIISHFLFTIYKYLIDTKDTSIQIFESKNESTSGSDLELYIEVLPKKYVYFLIQAKKLYANVGKPKYKEISHKVGKAKESQLEILLSYAKRHKAIPLYLLYNYSETFTKKDKEFYGCSIVLAQYIEDNFQSKVTAGKWSHIPTFSDLHDCTPIIAQPLYKLGYKSILKTVKKLYPHYSLIEEKDINTEDWVDISTCIPFEESHIAINKNDGNSYSPGFRIVQKLQRTLT